MVDPIRGIDEVHICRSQQNTNLRGGQSLFVVQIIARMNCIPIQINGKFGWRSDIYY